MNTKIAEFLERKLIKTIVLLVLTVSCLYRFDIRVLGDYNQILSNTVTVVSIFIGILMSMMGFLLTVTGMKVVKSIVNVGAHKMILSYFLFPIMVGIVIVLLSTTMDIIINNIYDVNKVAIIVTIVWLCLCVYFIGAFVRIVILMYLILIEVFNEINIDDDNGCNKNLSDYVLVEKDYADRKENGNLELSFDDPDMYD